MSKQGNSFATVATQIINYNNNVLQLLNSYNDITTSNQSSVPINFTDEFGVLRTFTAPSYGYLLGEIQRLNNNLNSLYSIDTNGALIQQSNNKYKKIITVDLNREPNTIGSLSVVNNFVKNNNWFFDSLLNPMLQIEIDLSDKIEDNVRKSLVRRYILEFEKDTNGELTNLGQSALNSFNNDFRSKSDISLEDFTYWQSTTPGVSDPGNPLFDEQMFDLEPNELLYDGIFSVIRIDEDTLNRKLWYVLDTLDYIVTESNEPQQLSLGDELIINQELTTTKYKIIEVSTSESLPRIRLERVEGLEPVPVIEGALKIYSPVIYNKVVRVSIGYDERNVLFIKPMNAENHLLAKDWSLGIGYWTNDFTLVSDDSDNGKTMEQFYEDSVVDYGSVLKDLVEKNVPTTVGGTPNIPELISDNFKVVQVNTHLTDTKFNKDLSTKHNFQKNLKSEIGQLNQSIRSKQRFLRTTKFSNKSAYRRYSSELNDMLKQQNSKSKTLQSTVGEILSLSSSAVNTKVKPKYRLRGFWEMPESAIVKGSKPQQIVQFIIQYRYLSNDGRENPVASFKVEKSDGSLAENAAFTNWITIKSEPRKHLKDESTGNWYWEEVSVSDSDKTNPNQLDIPIKEDEKLEIRVKSLSEVGWPDSPLESEWSEILSYEFPSEQKTALADNDFIIREATSDDLKGKIEEDLENKGLYEHLEDSTVIEDNTYFHEDKSILMTGVKDSSNNSISLFEYINSLEKRIESLEEAVNKSKGVLQVTILRGDEEFIIKNNEERSFNVECEDYLTDYTGTNAPTGRVYTNDIYIIKDFVVKVSNIASSSPLGLLSNQDYYTNSDFMRTDAPQIFWVNDRDELLTNTSTGSTRNQLDNQFIWSCNYTSLDQTSVVKLSENISNDFTIKNSNSITDVLSSTEYNIGYEENTILNFVNNNNSVIEVNKWSDDNVSVSSNRKLLTSVHPVVQNLEDIVETNSNKVKTIEAGEDNSTEIPINIYFKMNSVDPNSGSGNNFEYIKLNRARTTVRHIKKVRFYLANESENKPFIFTIRFNINRNRVGVQKIVPNSKLLRSSKVSR